METANVEKVSIIGAIYVGCTNVDIPESMLQCSFVNEAIEMPKLLFPVSDPCSNVSDNVIVMASQTNNTGK